MDEMRKNIGTKLKQTFFYRKKIGDNVFVLDTFICSTE